MTYKGYRHTPEAKAKIGAASLENTYALGYRHTDDARERIGKAGTGRYHSQDARAKIGMAHKNKVVSPETRAKLRAANIGRSVPPETRAKISAALRGKSNYRFREIDSAHKRHNGYVLIKTKDGWAMEHRVIMGLEPGDPRVVHHIDRNKQNNDPANLQIFDSQSEHARHHNLLDSMGDGRKV